MKKAYWFLLLIVLGACKDKYVPDIHIPASSFLVVEGFINVGDGPTSIQLSRAAALDSPVFIPEPGASLEVQSENGASFPLQENQTGVYTVNQLPIDPGQKYRLHIRTSNGKEYLSALSEVKLSPPIDTVTWEPDADGLNVYVSTHDDQKKTLYYQWQFEETWKYNSAFGSNLEYKEGNLIIRPDEDMIFTCWRSDLSTSISIASSAKLDADVIHEFPLTKILFYSTDKLINRYSILVKQFALTKEWYEWKLKIKKNTEQLGSIFDAQPSQTGGNITCITNPGEPAIGFIGCTSETVKRIFIDRSEIPPTAVFSGYEFCAADSVALSDIDKAFSSGYIIPLRYFDIDGFAAGVLGGEISCTDCRSKGGTLTRPPFWK